MLGAMGETRLRFDRKGKGSGDKYEKELLIHCAGWNFKGEGK
jgi:hypothetical protein